MKRLLRRLSSRTRQISFVAMILALCAMYGTIMIAFEKFPNIDPSKNEDRVVLVGLMAVFIIVLQSVGNALYGVLWPEKRIVSDLGVSGSRYSFEHLLDEKSHEIFIIGQNLRTLMSTQGFKARIKMLIQKNKELKIWFIGATYNGMKEISKECAEHFDNTLKDFKEIYEELGEKADKLYVRFHPSAISLSCIIRDPDDDKRGILVMTPKWARDADPANRHYCVIEKWEYRELFNRVAGHRIAMVQTDSQRLKDICSVIDKEIDSGMKGNTYNIKSVLQYFKNKDLP